RHFRRARGDRIPLRWRRQHCGPWRSWSWSSCIPHHDLVFELDAVSFFDAIADLGNQREHVLSGSLAGVDEEIGVTFADAGTADAQSLQAELVDHAAGGSSGRILEDAAGAFLPHGLAGAPLFVADANSLDYFVVRFGG